MYIDHKQAGQTHPSLLVPILTKGRSDTTALEHVESLLRIQTTDSLIHRRPFLVRGACQLENGVPVLLHADA